MSENNFYHKHEKREQDIYHNGILNSKSSRSIQLMMLCGRLEGPSWHLASNKYNTIQSCSSSNMPSKQFPRTSLNERNDEEAHSEHRKSQHRKELYQDELLAAALRAFLDGECRSGLESELMAILPIPASMASLSSLSLFFWSEIVVSAVALLLEGIDGSKRRGPAFIHGCCRH